MSAVWTTGWRSPRREVAEMPVQAPQEVTRRQAATIAGVHYNTVRLWERHGRIHPRRAPNGEMMIDVRELEEIMRDRGTTQPDDRSRIAALEAENKLLREQLAVVSERYEKLLDKVLQLTGQGIDGKQGR